MAQGCVTEPKSKDDVSELYHINVGGNNYEISKHVMSSVTGSRLHRLAQDNKYGGFFERPRLAFESILAYHQTGQLHMPGNLCPGAFKREMEFWDVNPHVMENCCYHRYVTFVRDQTILNGFLAKTKQTETLNSLMSDRSTRIARLRARMWSVLDNKDDSTITKVYFCVATTFILLAIFATALGTLPHTDTNATASLEPDNTTMNDTTASIDQTTTTPNNTNGLQGYPPDMENQSPILNPDVSSRKRGKRALRNKRSFATLDRVDESLSDAQTEHMDMSEQQHEDPTVALSVAGQQVIQQNGMERKDDQSKQTNANRISVRKLYAYGGQQTRFRQERDVGTPSKHTHPLDQSAYQDSETTHTADDKWVRLSPHTMLVRDKLDDDRIYSNGIQEFHTSQHKKHDDASEGEEQRIDLQPGHLDQHQHRIPERHQQENPEQHQQGNPEQHQQENPEQHQQGNPEQHQQGNPEQHQQGNPEQHQQGNPEQHQQGNTEQHQQGNTEQHQQGNTEQHQEGNPGQIQHTFVNDVKSERNIDLFSRGLVGDDADSVHASDVNSDNRSSTGHTFNGDPSELISGNEHEQSHEHHIRIQRSLADLGENTTQDDKNLTGDDVKNITGYAENVTEYEESVTQVTINVTLSVLNLTSVLFNESNGSYPGENIPGFIVASNTELFSNATKIRTNILGNIESVKDVIDTILPEASTSKILTMETAVDEKQLTYIYIEYATNVFFTWELFLRLLCCPRATQYIFSFQNVIDMLVLAAVYTRSLLFLLDTQDYQSDIDILLYLQMLRVLRLLRLLENVTAYKVLCYSMRVGKNDIFLILLCVFIGVLFFSNFVYFFERNEDFPSIPDAWWWCIVTMTTVGYGDMVPKTIIGKIIGSVCALSGVFMFSLIIPIFVNTFLLIYQYAEVQNRDVALLQNIHTKKHTSYKIREERV